METKNVLPISHDERRIETACLGSVVLTATYDAEDKVTEVVIDQRGSKIVLRNGDEVRFLSSMLAALGYDLSMRYEVKRQRDEQEKAATEEVAS